MLRREFIAGTAATAAVGSMLRAARAEVRAPDTKRIAIVHPTDPPEALTVNGRRAYKAYFEELKRLGYIEGQNLIVDRYSALGKPDRYDDLARAIVASRPDVIVPFGSPLTRQFKSLNSSVPIVAATGDPVVTGLVTNLARHGGNITGVSVDAGLDVWGKRLQLLGEAARKLTKVRFLVTARGQSWWEATETRMRQAAEGAGIEISAAPIVGNIDRAAYERTFDSIESDGADGLVVSDGGEHVTNRGVIVDLAARHHLPAIYPYREFVEAGGLLAYGADVTDMMHRLAGITYEVLSGANPGDIPFYLQAKYELVLNRTTAGLLGLEFPTSLLAVADEVIE
jgi:putative ABC transport system substrate-binding protein